MRLQHHTKEDPDVDLTSLIDVVFLLLLFFMVSTTFDKQALLKVDLPEASMVEDRADIPESLELVIDDEGSMYLNDQRLIDSEARSAACRRRLLAVSRGLEQGHGALRESVLRRRQAGRR